MPPSQPLNCHPSKVEQTRQYGLNGEIHSTRPGLQVFTKEELNDPMTIMCVLGTTEGQTSLTIEFKFKPDNCVVQTDMCGGCRANEGITQCKTLDKLPFQLILETGGWGTYCEIALKRMSLDLTDDKSTLVQVMAWCLQATSHYLSQCWSISMASHGVTRP